MKPTHLFVYGTLRKDHKSGKSRLLDEGAEFLCTGRIRGRLFDVGRYPGFILSRKGYPVTGEVYRITKPEELLPVLDDYEECSRNFKKPWEYKRKKVSVQIPGGKIVKCWIYIYNRPTDGLDEIRSGDYCLEDSSAADGV